MTESDGGRVDSDVGQLDGATGPVSWRVLDALDQAVFRLDADGALVAVNDAFASLTGLDREVLLGESLDVAFDREDAVRLEAEVERRYARDVEGDTVPVTLLPDEGEPVPCEVDLVLGTDDGGERTVIGITDVETDIQSAEELASIWETYRSISSVVDEAEVGVFVVDDEFDIAWVDETAEQYFGIDREAVIGRDKRSAVDDTIQERLADPEAFEETVLATYEDNSYVERFECRITPGPEREGRWLEHRSKPIDSGRFAGGRVELYYDITDRKESQLARRESEQQFASLVDAVTEYAIFQMDPEGVVTTWNPGAERIKGYEPREIVGEHFSTFYTEEDRAAGVPESNLAAAAEEGSTEDEGWRLRADGSRFWARVTISAIRDENGEIEGFAKVTRDMTDRREREQALQRERDLIDRIFETSPVGIAVANPDGSVDRANERMAELFGLGAGDFADYALDDLDVYAEDGDRLAVEERPTARAFETGEPVFDEEVRLETPEGERRWVSMNVAPITDGGDEPERVVTTATDVTQLKRLAEQRKRALRERERELDAIRTATNLLEPDDRPVGELLRDFADRLPAHFESPGETAVRISVGDHEVATDDVASFDRSITTATRTEYDTPIEVEVARPSSVAPDSHDPFLDEERELIETLATLLTFHFDRREFIRELQVETERLEQFAYAASHDMKEPLRMVSTYLQLLERRYGDEFDEDGEEYLEFALDGAQRMHDMIEGLLAYSRVQRGGDPFEPVDLEAVLADVREDLQLRIAETGAEVAVGALPTVAGDPGQLRQVFQNLLDNALEYSGEEPPYVEVSAERDGDGRDGDRWIVSVRDEGIGMDPDRAEDVFEVFERLHSRSEHEGTGIGLALVERIVERHGGEIWVESTPGEGSTFTVSLPAADPED